MSRHKQSLTGNCPVSGRNFKHWLNKSRGHVLRIATVLHLLFHLDDPHHRLDVVVSEETVRATVKFIQVTSQHTTFIKGRGLLSEEHEEFKAGKCIAVGVTDYSRFNLRWRVHHFWGIIDYFISA